jgi:mono/diheme cytochrome c family protein
VKPGGRTSALLAAVAVSFAAFAVHAGEDLTPRAAGRADRLALHDYMLNCMGCHGGEGEGVEGKVPPLVGMDRHFESPRGREYLIRVPGVAQSGLSDRRLALLMNWALVRFGSREFEPYTADEISAWRANPLRTSEGFFESR